MGAGVVQREKGWTGVEAGAGPRAEEKQGHGFSRSREKQGHGFSPRASGGRNLPTPRFQPRETRVGPLPAGTQRRGDKFVLSSAARLGQLVRAATGSPQGRAEGGPAQPGAGGTWCRELLIFGAQEEPPWTPSCRTL